MSLRFYAQASTANPTGRRPWNSRLSFYVPNSFNPPTTGQGPFLLQPGIVGRPAQNGGLGFYKRARFAVPTTSMSGLGQTSNGTRRVGVIARRMPSPVTGTVAAPYGGVNPIPIGAQNPIVIGPSGTFRTGATPTGFSPIGTAPSGSNLYTSAPGLESQAAAQGYYIVGYRNGQPIYSTNPSASAAANPATAAQVTGYDASGVPIYSSPPAGAYVVGTDASGNPIYSNNPSAAQLVAASQAGTAAAAAPAAAAPTSSLSDFLSQDSLGFGLNNGWYLAIGAGALILFTSKRGR